MLIISVKEAREKLSFLLDQIEQGEEVVIKRRGHIIAKLSNYVGEKEVKSLPSLKGFRHQFSTTATPLSQIVIQGRDES